MIFIKVYLIGVCLSPILIFLIVFAVLKMSCKKENPISSLDATYYWSPNYGTWKPFVPNRIVITSKYFPKYLLKKHKSKMEMDGYFDEARGRLKDNGIEMEARIEWDRYMEVSRSLGGTKSRFYLSIICESKNIDKIDVNQCLQDIRDDFYFLELK